MADFPIGDGGGYEVEGRVNTTGTVITASATANVKGAYTQLVAATGFDASELFISIFGPSAAFFCLLDIAVGAAGAEVDILPNIFSAFTAVNRSTYEMMRMPVSVPAGSRLAARIQASVASATIAVMVHILRQGLMAATPLSRATAYGTAAGTSRGTTVTTSATVDTKGAVAQLDPATANPIRALGVLFGNTAIPVDPTRNMMDIAVGASGSEVVVIPNIPFVSLGTRGQLYGYQLLPASIPAGTRLSALAQSNTTSVSMDVAALGFD